jgi:hypothetical protein
LDFTGKPNSRIPGLAPLKLSKRLLATVSNAASRDLTVATANSTPERRQRKPCSTNRDDPQGSANTPPALRHLARTIRIAPCTRWHLLAFVRIAPRAGGWLLPAPRTLSAPCTVCRLPRSIWIAPRALRWLPGSILLAPRTYGSLLRVSWRGCRNGRGDHNRFQHNRLLSSRA